MTTAQMNGLEYLTAIKNGELPGSAMGQLDSHETQYCS